MLQNLKKTERLKKRIKNIFILFVFTFFAYLCEEFFAYLCEEIKEHKIKSF
jgi:hypothetical protein